MAIVNLTPNNTTELVALEEQAHWRPDQWQYLWKKEAKYRFVSLVNDYLEANPQGCFGLLESGVLQGAMFLVKTTKLAAIPRLHGYSQVVSPDGRMGQVTFWVTRDKSKEVLAALLQEATKRAKLGGWQKLGLVTSSSWVDQVLRENDFREQEDQVDWEKYPGFVVQAKIWYLEPED